MGPHAVLVFFGLFLTFNGFFVEGGIGIVMVGKGIEGSVLVRACCFSFLATVLQCSN